MTAQETAALADVNKEALSRKLRSAFSNAVFLGYIDTANLLAQALDQVEPLNYLDVKTARYMTTEIQMQAMLARQAAELAALQAADVTPKDHERYISVRTAFNERKKDVEAKSLGARETLDTDASAAMLLADKLHQPKVSALITEAQMSAYKPQP
jgi:hypothetical protein